MTSARIAAKPLTPFGVETAINLSTPLSTADEDELRALFARDGLLVLRGLELTMAQQQAFCRIFGPVSESPFESFYVSNVRSDGHLGNRELQWHNDVPYLPAPYTVAALHAVEVSLGASTTRFASGLRAYERLPQPLRDRIEGLTALQVKQRLQERANRLADLRPGDLCTVHAVVRRQGGTGRPYIFVNENMTACVIGLSDADSDALLAEVFTHFYVADDVYEHVWQPGDLVLWDNQALQHARGRVSAEPRTLQRVSCTRFGYYEQYPADAAIYEDFGNAVMLTPAA
jgi:taurine dioxygenase